MVYCSEAENLGGLLSDVSGRKPCKQRSSRSKCKHLLRVGGNVTEEWKIGEFGSCRQRKIRIAATKFDEFCNQKFDKRGILFCTGFVERPRYVFTILRGWMVQYHHSGFLRDSSKSQIET